MGCPRFSYTGDGTHSRHGVILYSALRASHPLAARNTHRARGTDDGSGGRGPRHARQPAAPRVPWALALRRIYYRPWDVKHAYDPPASPDRAYGARVQSTSRLEENRRKI
eukprot:scaffold51600_cov55-Phaeocystis_antarctica.AAC.1